MVTTNSPLLVQKKIPKTKKNLMEERKFSKRIENLKNSTYLIFHNKMFIEVPNNSNMTLRIGRCFC